jgi:predicted GIY-YIG superfamily endonuclease
MVHWVYVLECEDNHIYVGETKQLYTRMKQHMTAKGALNTKSHKPKRLIGLYKVNTNHAFMKYRQTTLRGEYNRFILTEWNEDGDNLLIENHITERLIHERRDAEWYKVRGGKYTRKDLEVLTHEYAGMATTTGFTVHAKIPICDISTEQIVDRPLCKCGMPSEVNLSKDTTKIYFTCALSNIWKDLAIYIPVNKTCDFWQLYTEDISVKLNYKIIETRSKEEWVSNIPKSLYKIYPEACVICSKLNYVPIFNKEVKRLCQHCILNKYDTIKEAYSTKCLIMLG